MYKYNTRDVVKGILQNFTFINQMPPTEASHTPQWQNKIGRTSCRREFYFVILQPQRFSQKPIKILIYDKRTFHKRGVQNRRYKLE